MYVCIAYYNKDGVSRYQMCVCVCVCANTYAQIISAVSICHLCMYVDVCVCVCVRMYVDVCVCVRMYVYVC